MIIPRFNTGFKNQGHYMQACMVMVMENRVPSAHYRYLSHYLADLSLFVQM